MAGNTQRRPTFEFLGLIANEKVEKSAVTSEKIQIFLKNS
jgi:hypothetical protein